MLDGLTEIKGPLARHPALAAVVDRGQQGDIPVELGLEAVEAQDRRARALDNLL